MASEKITAIVESVKTMTVLELKELVDTICEEFGVSAVAAAAPAAAGAAAPVEEEKTEFDVILADVGACRKTDQEIYQALQKELLSIDPHYHIEMMVDRNFIRGKVYGESRDDLFGNEPKRRENPSLSMCI